jgi:solute carrier family 8 (sodium/calcium exchanger)
MWAFLGVAIVADVFMGAIEKITSKKKAVYIKGLNEYRTITIWNDTVANLTLMALGSSAPEILLGVIEICGNQFYAGALGPSTIVGSAAFNLFVITAVCVVAIPGGQSRSINDLGVFAVTASFSIFAYAWLYFIVAMWTPETVSIEEAVITLLLFPALVLLAYAADKGYFSDAAVYAARKASRQPRIEDLTREQIAEIEMQERDKFGDLLTESHMAKLISNKVGFHRSRLQYRSDAIRGMIGSARQPTFWQQTHDRMKVVPANSGDDLAASDVATLNFGCTDYKVMENCGKVDCVVELILTGELSDLPVPLAVKYVTKDGTAKHPNDYLHTEGELLFMPGDMQQTITISIIDDQDFEQEENFSVDIFDPQIKNTLWKGSSAAQIRAVLGRNMKAVVTITDDDQPGVLRWQNSTMKVMESSENKFVECIVERANGCTGQVSCHYKTEDVSAVAGKDYEAVEGTLEFANGQSSATLRVNIFPKGLYEKQEIFRLVLDNPTGGATMDTTTDGGEKSCILTIAIQADPQSKQFVDNVFSMLVNHDKNMIGYTSWAEQFRNAVAVEGGEDGEPPDFLAYVMHILTVFWKILFALIPPAEYCDGWLCFYASLVMIGLVTLFIGDISSLLGCVLGLPDEVTAITFVALGTSLPDTFASKSAAMQDPYADASIGNVTGSNSVNVFLGIGLSWTIGAIYWATQDGEKWASKYGSQAEIRKMIADHPQGGVFAVKSGDLGFSVVVFCACASVGISVLMARRWSGIGELGGPPALAKATAVFFVCLWLLYVGLSTYKTFDSLKDDPCK